jgi:PAS domain S-box-containing protein
MDGQRLRWIRASRENAVAQADQQLLDHRLQAFIDQGPLTVYVYRPEGPGPNAYMSPQLEAVLGYTAEEWTADPDLFSKVLHPDDRDWVLAEQRRTQEAGEPFRAEYRMMTRDGRVLWFLDEAHEVAGRKGEPAYYYGYLVEITERKELEEAVRAAEERYRALVEQLPLAIYVDRLDELSSNVYSSPQIERMIGYTAEQWAAEDDLFVRLLHPADRDRVLREHGRTRTTGAPLRTEYRLITADGRVIWIRDEGLVVRDERGKPLVLQGFLLDITERKMAEEALRDSEAELARQKAYYQELHGLSPVAIVTLDKDNRVLSWNPAAERLFGYAQGEAIDRPLADLLFPTEDLREESRAVQRQAEDHGLAHVIARRARKDGVLVDVEILTVPLVVDGERTGFLVLYHNITELQRAREEAEAATQAKSAFLATMSHEIRTPMNAVIGMGGLLLDTELTEEQRGFAEVIRTSGEGLLRIIDDILDFSKIEAGKLELEQEPLDVRNCAESALDLVAVRASEKELEIGCLIDQDVPIAILGDPTRLRQALANLLANAVKFTEAGEVVLTVVTETGGDVPRRLRFSVWDTGIGMPAERMPHLFESFSQMDASTRRRYGGTGLGLAISKRLAELMGGTLWADSEEGKGSVFHFEIPAREVTPPARYDRGEAAPRIAGKRLLVVDDSATNREILTRQAESWGMLVEAVERPADALYRVRRGDRFDAAVLDMQMPEMDGLALAREIRRYRDEGALPLVLLTSIGRLAVGGGPLEFSAQLTKPVKASQLYEALVRVLAVEAAPASTPGGEDDDSRPAAMALRLLVAEDNAVNRQLALALLAKLGYQADVVENGREALDAVEREAYDVVLMDVQMPELDGLEASRRIRDRFGSSGGPMIIATTANAMEGDREECLEAGMDDYLSKPIHLDDLSRALARCRPLARTGAQRTVPGGSGTGSRETLDHAALESLVSSLGGGDEGWRTVRELLDTFIEDAAAQIAILRDAIARGDAEEAQRAAHTLKSSSATFGANSFAELCRELETLGRREQFDAAPELLERAENEWERLQKALAAARQSSTVR